MRRNLGARPASAKEPSGVGVDEPRAGARNGRDGRNRLLGGASADGADGWDICGPRMARADSMAGEAMAGARPAWALISLLRAARNARAAEAPASAGSTNNGVGARSVTATPRTLARFSAASACFAVVSVSAVSAATRRFRRAEAASRSRWRSPTSWFSSRAPRKSIAEKKIAPVIDAVLPLEKAAEGLRLIQDREVIGKVVVVP